MTSHFMNTNESKVIKRVTRIVTRSFTACIYFQKIDGVCSTLLQCNTTLLVPIKSHPLKDTIILA